MVYEKKRLKLEDKDTILYDLYDLLRWTGNGPDADQTSVGIPAVRRRGASEAWEEWPPKPQDSSGSSFGRATCFLGDWPQGKQNSYIKGVGWMLLKDKQYSIELINFFVGFEGLDDF